ncbi:kinase-like protein [Neolentinus lepideus HHB14362 ss-1]|uniref:Kinase-like protein n=1 Tax=Neolentinus lepideus HHB14362 ss-1 TaxID=1314782 RepID=A0A165TKZ6_9AGAM|nr:kinase-like protein [Neolentinus lepideus HHB14362 ss-1]
MDVLILLRKSQCPRYMHSPAVPFPTSITEHIRRTWARKRRSLSRYCACKVGRTTWKSYKGGCYENVWYGLDNPHVLPFYGFKFGIGFEEFRNTIPGMVSPFCENGTVMSYMESQVRNGTDPTGLRSTMIAGIAQGLRYLHNNNVVHGDLKPANVLIGDNGQPLLADFGLSRILGVRGFTLSLQAGSTAYTAPEILWSGQGSVINQVDTRSDIYSLAMTIWEIYARKPPFERTLPMTIVWKVAMDPEHHRPPRVGDIEEECWDLLERCWAHEADERPIIDNVVPFFVAVNEGEA